MIVVLITIELSLVVAVLFRRLWKRRLDTPVLYLVLLYQAEHSWISCGRAVFQLQFCSLRGVWALDGDGRVLDSICICTAHLWVSYRMLLILPAKDKLTGGQGHQSGLGQGLGEARRSGTKLHGRVYRNIGMEHYTSFLSKYYGTPVTLSDHVRANRGLRVPGELWSCRINRTISPAIDVEEESATSD